MPKITFIGAGSTIFAKNLMGDILSYPELADSTIVLHDIDEQRLQESAVIGRRIAKILEVKPTIETTIDRRAALDEADYAIGMFQVAGYKPGTVIDFEIPKKYGLRQTIADTLGIGGIMRALRTIPVMLEMCHDMEELCPEVTFLNYVNPMAMNCWAVSRGERYQNDWLCVTACKGPPRNWPEILRRLSRKSTMCAPVSIIWAFYLKFEREGEDLYPLIGQVLEEGRVPDGNQVRYELFKRVGYFVTESSEHFSEYVPWFIKRDRPDLIEEFNVPLDEYIRRCERQIMGWGFAQRKLADPDGFFRKRATNRAKRG